MQIFVSSYFSELAPAWARFCSPGPAAQVLRGVRVLLMGLILGLAVAAPAQAERAVDPKAEPNAFMEAIANNMLDAVKTDPGARQGDVAAITRLVEQYAMPYVDMNKTTRLSAGRYWRQASDAQKSALIEAFKGTLIRTYSGAFTRVDNSSQIRFLPFRGDPQADDAVVRSTVSQPNAPSVSVDYRLERSPQGWRIYDLGVEGIWLIQNYRNQFAQQINSNGIDGLIKALKAHTASGTQG